MTAGPLFIAPSPDPVGYVIMAPDGTPSRLVIGASAACAVKILDRAIHTGTVTIGWGIDATITPMTAAEYTRRTGLTMHPVAMSTAEQRRRITGRARTA